MSEKIISGPAQILNMALAKYGISVSGHARSELPFPPPEMDRTPPDGYPAWRKSNKKEK